MQMETRKMEGEEEESDKGKVYSKLKNGLTKFQTGNPRFQMGHTGLLLIGRSKARRIKTTADLFSILGCSCVDLNVYRDASGVG